jgi:hypothetical protein
MELLHHGTRHGKGVGAGEQGLKQTSLLRLQPVMGMCVLPSLQDDSTQAIPSLRKYGLMQ